MKKRKNGNAGNREVKKKMGEDERSVRKVIHIGERRKREGTRAG